MAAIRILRPNYSRNFHCIGSECEDYCCTGWQVVVDPATVAKYQSLQSSPLFPLFQQYLVLPAEATSLNPDRHPTIQMQPNGDCPFLSEERLCRIQQEHGADALSHTCSVYPRVHRIIDGLEEDALMLSCPEAVRVVLLDDALAATLDDGHSFAGDEAAPPEPGLKAHFWAIREFSLNLVTNPLYPLWQRVFLLGALARRLEAIAQGQLQRSVPDLLRDLSSAVQQGSLRTAMEGIQPNLALQQDLLVNLIDVRLRMQCYSEKFKELLVEVGQGIGHVVGCTPESRLTAYRSAWKNYAQPFFDAHPQFLQNYVINQIFRSVFPFGKELFHPELVPSPARAFSQLAIQFALLKGLLIGAAGFHKERFTPAVAVRTVELAYRAFHHNDSFLEQAQQLLAERQMDNPQGLTMLIRN